MNLGRISIHGVGMVPHGPQYPVSDTKAIQLIVDDRGGTAEAGGMGVNHHGVRLTDGIEVSIPQENSFELSHFHDKVGIIHLTGPRKTGNRFTSIVGAMYGTCVGTRSNMHRMCGIVNS